MVILPYLEKVSQITLYKRSFSSRKSITQSLIEGNDACDM